MRRVALYALFAAGGLIVVAFVALRLLGGFYKAPSESMAPTIAVGDRFTVLNVGTPKVGDIVVHYPPAGAELDAMCGAKPRAGEMCARPTTRRADVKFVKRIVAAGGDRISMRGGTLTRNGKPETTKGPQPCSGAGECDFPREITVPEGYFFVLGDNRGSSDDSRFWGPIKEDWVIGRYWFGLG